MVSRVPATLAMCPCQSPETPLGPCSPVSVPVQTPPPWGRLSPCLHLFWVRRHLLGCLRATGTLESPQSSPLCPPHPQPSPRCILKAVPSQGSCGASSFSSCSLKGADHLSIPSLGCPERLPISIRHSILVHFQSLLPSLEATNQSPRPGESSQVGLLPDSHLDGIFAA